MSERQSLTARQQEIYDFIRDSIRNGCSPTVREIGEHFGITSPNGVMCHVDALQTKGYIVRDGLNKSRSIRLTGKTLREAVGEMLKVTGDLHLFKIALEEVRRIYRGSA